MKIVIIGGVACGPKTASRLKRLCPESEITLIERGKILSYGACGLPYYVEGSFDNIDELINTPVGVPRNETFFKKVKGFEALTETEAIKIDREQKKVTTKHLPSGEQKEISYDKLVLATGATPIQPNFSGKELTGVHVMQHPNDAEKVLQTIKMKKDGKAVCIGAGLIGLEMAEAFRAHNLETTIVEMCDHIMPALLDHEIAALPMKHLQEHGIKLAMGEKVEGFEGNEQGELVAVKTTHNRYPANVAIVSIGVAPNDGLAKDAGLEVGTKGGIIVNQHCQTSDPDIYAGGDCVLNKSILPEDPNWIYAPQGSTANKHGRVIADHISGRDSSFPGIGGSIICRVFDYTVGRNGLSEKQARELGIDIETVVVTGPDKPHFLQGKPLIIKLIAGRKNRRLLGCQVTGLGNVDKRLDVLLTAITLQASIEQLAYLDLAYAPPYSAAVDVMTTAIHVLENKLSGIACSVSALDVKKMIEAKEEVVLVDTRTPKEVAEVRLPYPTVNIPLGMLREKALTDLPQDKKIVPFCKLSLRGYEAQRILQGLGFKDVWFMEGGIVGWPYKLDK